MRGRGWRRAIRRGLDSFRQDPPVGPVVQGGRSAEGADFVQERRGVSRQRVPDASGQGVPEGQPHLAAGQGQQAGPRGAPSPAGAQEAFSGGARGQEACSGGA
eukprot:6805026-Pyramimonas_sp.AAC.1